MPPSFRKNIFDLLLAIACLFLTGPLMDWQQSHLQASCWLLMLLNIVAVGYGCITFFSLYAEEGKLVAYRNSLSSFENAVIGLSAFISCLGFLWWLAPFAGVKKMGVQDTGFIPGATIYFITFLAAVASSINKKKSPPTAPLLTAIGGELATTVFFFFSYAFLLMALRHWQPSFMAAPYLAILCLFVFYLPLRFFLLLRPPFSKWEYVGFILSFGVMVGKVMVGE